MAIVLNGTSQYVSLGNGVNPVSARPFTFACLFDSALLRTSGAYGVLYSQGTIWYSSGAGTGGWSVLIEAAASPRAEVGYKSGGAARSGHTTLTITPNTGLWLIVAVVRDAGATTVADVFAYRYSNNTLTVNSAVTLSPTADSDPSAPEGDDPTMIGAGNTGAGTEDFFPGNIHWVGIWARDLGLAGSASAPLIWELIRNGGWRIANRGYDCRLFMPLSNAYGARDLSYNNFNGSLVASPSWGRALLTENPPASLFVVPGDSASPQTISPGGIASAEAFGAGTLIPGSVTVSPGGIASAEAIGSAAIASSVAPGGIGSTEAIGAAQLATGPVTVAPGGLASGEAFGNTVVSGATVFVLPGAIGSAEAFGAETITPGAVQVSPGGIAAGEAFGTAALGLSVAPAGLAGAEAFGAAAVIPGAAIIAPGGIAGGEAFGAMVVAGPTFNYNISVGAGYTDVSPKQLVRTKGNRLYVCASECDSYPCEATAQKLRMYGANQTGLQSSFSRKDSTHEPGGVAGWAIAIDGNDLIHVVWTERTSNGGTITNLKYTTFDPATDTWSGTIETVVSSMNTDGVGQGVQTVALALDSSGVPHIVYVQGSGTARRVYYRNRSGGTWSGATQLDTGVTYSGNQRAWHPNLAFDGSGRILALWLRGTFNDTADGTIYSRVYSGGSWGSTVQVSATSGALTSIDQSTAILITPDGTYHTTYINASLTPGNKYIRYRYSTDQGATWTANDPGSGTQATHNPSLGWTGSKIRIMAHGTPDAGNHGINLYYFESDGGSATWGSWTQFVTGSNFDSSVATRWAQYFNHYPHTLDIAYWDDNYPNNLYVGTQIFGLDVELAGLASGEAFGAAAVGLVIAPAGIGSSEAFGGGAITVGGVSLTLAGIASGEAVGAAVVSAGSYLIQAAGIGSAEGFGSLVVNVGGVSLALTGIASQEAIGPAVLSAGAILILTGIGSTEVFGGLVLAPGEVTLQPDGIGSAEAFGNLALGPGGISLQPGGIGSAEVFGGTILTKGEVVLMPISISSNEVFGGTVMTPGEVMVQPTGIVSSEAFGVSMTVPGAFIGVESITSQEGVGLPSLLRIIQPHSISTGELIGILIIKNTRILFGYGMIVKGVQGSGMVQSQTVASSVESG